ncbi:hypothetical protein ABZX98_22710 [Streptomyces sp. NPDC002992]|uniref:zinc finger domain-containing protein n=1 Tax=Streptomyces sp. NPDC002992 TaxID=3154273 RepID=UPI0033A6CC81
MSDDFKRVEAHDCPMSTCAAPAGSPCDIAKRLVITTGAKKDQHPSPATVMRMLREHDEQAATVASA